jgi:hypothetical protein
MDKKELAAFERELPRPPMTAPRGGTRHSFSSGTHELMSMMMGKPGVTARTTG